MSVSTVLYSRLSTFAGLVALVETRTYPLKLPQQVTYPAIRYQIITDLPTNAMRTTDNLHQTMVQVDAFSKSYLSCEAVKDQINLALQRWSNPISSPVIEDVVPMGSHPMYEDELELYRWMLEFKLIARD